MESQASLELTQNDADELSNIACEQTPHISGESTLSPATSPEDGVAAETSMTQASTPTENTTVTPVVPGKRKRVQQNTMEKLLQALKAPIVLRPRESAPQAPEEPSPNLLFLKSLLPDMDSASPRGVRNIKIRIIQFLQEELEQDARQCSHSPGS